MSGAVPTGDSAPIPTPSSRSSNSRGRGRGRGRGRNRNSNRGQGRGRGGASSSVSTVDPLLSSADRAAHSGTGVTESTLTGEHGTRTSRRRTQGSGRAGRGGQGRGAARKAAGVKKPDPRDTGDGDDVPLCMICANQLVYFAVGECNHPGRCATCAMRSRVLLKDRSCPECKTLLDRLVVAELQSNGVPPRFESFNLWGNFSGPDSALDDASGMIFYACQSHYDYLSHAAGFYCPMEGCLVGEDGDDVFPKKGALQDHMKRRHQRFFCNLCLDNRPLFPSEQEVFTAAALRNHEAGVDGHPLCRFCSQRYFDKTALYDHMTGTHINCHLCPEENQHRYFRGEPQLRDHLRTAHFLCDRVPCRQRGVVNAFNAPQELQDHLLTEHGITDRRKTVGFNVRRAGRDGSGVNTAAEGGIGDVYNSSAAAAARTGEALAAPDPDQELAGGIVVSVPSNRGRNSGVPGSDNFVPAGACGGNRSSSGTDGAGVFGPAGGGGGGGGGTSAGAGAARANWGGSTNRSSPVFEAFPSLPTPPPRVEERHEFSLVGRAISKSMRSERGGSAATAAAAAEKGGVVKSGWDGMVASPEKGDERRVLMRNKRLAEALGIRAALGAGAAIGGAKVGTSADGSAVAMGLGDGLDAIRDHLTRTNYSTFLVAWARNSRAELQKLERRLSDLVTDRKGTSTQFKPMLAENRRVVHELAVHYGLVTQSFDLEPKRYVSAIKQKGCKIPSRLLSVAARDPTYKGTDEALPDTTASAVVSTQESANRDTALQKAIAVALEMSPSPPRTRTVTSISSAKPPAAMATTLSSSNFTAVQPGSTCTSRSQPTIASSQKGGSEMLNASATTSGVAGTSVASAAAPGPSPESLLVLHSVQAGLGREAILERIRTLVPTRTVVRVRQATSLEASAAGLAQTSGALVAEFRSELYARRAWEKIEKDAEQLLAAARVTRTEYHAPFRACLFPAAAASSSIEASARVSGARALRANLKPPDDVTERIGDDDEVRDNWDSSDDDDGAEEGVSVKDNWDSSDDEEEKKSGDEGVEKLDVAAEAVLESLYGAEASDAGQERLVTEGSTEDPPDTAEENGEPAAGGADESKLCQGKCGGGSHEARQCGRLEEQEAVEEKALLEGKSAQDGDFLESETRAEDDGRAVGLIQTPEEDSSAPKWIGGVTIGSIPTGGGSSSLQWRAASGSTKRDGTSDHANTDAGGGAASAAGPAPPRRHSKWGNSAIKGRLARPSDGRATTVEQEANERQEKIEKLRRLEELRRETRKQRDQAKRAERMDAGKLDSHSFMWENLGESSSSSGEEGGDNDEESKDAASTGARGDLGEGPPQPLDKAPWEIEHRDHALESERCNEQGVRGWDCGVCTFWNEGIVDSGVGRPRCAMCDAEGPSDASSPWVTA